MFLSARRKDGREIRAGTLIAARGRVRSQYRMAERILGPAADNFLIRGSPHNRGTVLKLLLDKGVEPIGDATQCHAVAIDARAPKFDAASSRVSTAWCSASS